MARCLALLLAVLAEGPAVSQGIPILRPPRAELRGPRAGVPPKRPGAGPWGQRRWGLHAGGPPSAKLPGSRAGVPPKQPCPGPWGQPCAGPDRREEAVGSEEESPENGGSQWRPRAEMPDERPEVSGGEMESQDGGSPWRPRAELPDPREDYRRLMEAQNAMSEAGARAAMVAQRRDLLASKAALENKYRDIRAKLGISRDVLQERTAILSKDASALEKVERQLAALHVDVRFDWLLVTQQAKGFEQSRAQQLAPLLDQIQERQAELAVELPPLSERFPELVRQRENVQAARDALEPFRGQPQEIEALQNKLFAAKLELRKLASETAPTTEPPVEGHEMPAGWHSIYDS